MKKIILVTLLSMSAIAMAKETVIIPTGKFVIEGEKAVYINSQGQSQKLVVDDDSMYVNVKGKYTNKAKDKTLVLFEQGSGGVACPATYFIYEVSASEIKRTPTFGTCSDLIKVKQEDTKLTMTMPKLNQKGGETYKYENGVLTNNGKVVK